jgi:hypothetical protein
VLLVDGGILGFGSLYPTSHWHLWDSAGGRLLGFGSLYPTSHWHLWDSRDSAGRLVEDDREGTVAASVFLLLLVVGSLPVVASGLAGPWVLVVVASGLAGLVASLVLALVVVGILVQVDVQGSEWLRHPVGFPGPRVEEVLVFQSCIWWKTYGTNCICLQSFSQLGWSTCQAGSYH